MSIDLGEMYRASRARITEMVDDDVAELAVQPTPQWTVRDLLQALGRPVQVPDEFLSWVTPFPLADFDSEVAEQWLPPLGEMA